MSMSFEDLWNRPTLAAEPSEMMPFIKRAKEIEANIEKERTEIKAKAQVKGVDGITCIAYSMQLLMLDFYAKTVSDLRKDLERLIAAH
jgi:hypothetical protein